MMTPDIKERPFVPGWTYRAFVVIHPSLSGRVTLGIAHSEGRNPVLDLIREYIHIDDCCHLLRSYGIEKVTGAKDEGEGDALGHAVAGALVLANKA